MYTSTTLSSPRGVSEAVSSLCLPIRPPPPWLRRSFAFHHRREVDALRRKGVVIRLRDVGIDEAGFLRGCPRICITAAPRCCPRRGFAHFVSVITGSTWRPPARKSLAINLSNALIDHAQFRRWHTSPHWDGMGSSHMGLSHMEGDRAPCLRYGPSPLRLRRGGRPLPKSSAKCGTARG